MNIDPLSKQFLQAHPDAGNSVPDGTQVETQSTRQLLDQMRSALQTLWGFGTTAQRPTDPVLYQQFFDQTIGQMIVCAAIRVGSTPATWANIGAADTLFDHFADANNTAAAETDLYSDTLVANQFLNNGDKVYARYAGTIVNNANTKDIRVRFAGNTIYNSGAVFAAAAYQWDINCLLIRESATVLRCTTVFVSSPAGGTTALCNYVRLTGLTLSVPNILKLTGQSNAASNDITASMGTVEYEPAVIS